MSHSARIPDTHAEAWALLPWLVNGRLTDEEREWVEAHVEACEDCRREVHEQRALADRMRADVPPLAGSEQRAFAKLWSRIEAAEGALPAEGESGSRPLRTPSRTVRWLAAAVIVQTIGLAVLAFIAVQGRAGSADFRTVTDDSVQAPAGPAIRLVFDSGTPIGTVSDVLNQHGLQIVGGPSPAGVLTAALPEGSSQEPEAVAAALSGDPHVSFAQPVLD